LGIAPISAILVTNITKGHMVGPSMPNTTS